jgi:hypothetical protein
MTTAAEPKKAIKFTVNGTSVETDQHELTVRQILVLAGLDPETHYLVEKVSEEHEVEYRDLNQEVKLHNKQEFLAFFTGPTPVS